MRKARWVVGTLVAFAPRLASYSQAMPVGRLAREPAEAEPASSQASPLPSPSGPSLLRPTIRVGFISPTKPRPRNSPFHYYSLCLAPRPAPLRPAPPRPVGWGFALCAQLGVPMEQWGALLRTKETNGCGPMRVSPC